MSGISTLPRKRAKKMVPSPLGFRLRAWTMAAAILWGAFAIPLTHGATATVSQTLSANLAAIGKLSVPASFVLTATGGAFSSYGSSLTVNYRVRSTTSGSGASITLRSSADFSPAGGPGISINTLTYTCSGATLGTACSGTQTVSLSSATNILAVPVSACTGGGSPCSTANPNSVSTSFSLANDPAYKTGSYSATITFTISST